MEAVELIAGDQLGDALAGRGANQYFTWRTLGFVSIGTVDRIADHRVVAPEELRTKIASDQRPGIDADTQRLLTLFLYHHVRKLYPKDVAAMYPRTRRSRK